MSIWVDADACPKVIKEILFRAAERKAVPLTLVANRLQCTPSSLYISAIQPSQYFLASPLTQIAAVSALVLPGEWRPRCQITRIVYCRGK